MADKNSPPLVWPLAPTWQLVDFHGVLSFRKRSLLPFDWYVYPTRATSAQVKTQKRDDRISYLYLY